ncbi:universal stress protein [Actinoplanes sp. LDG1-06]|uniref:Universal stress protein n=1 Tax=Paractinoplanes ovalisporus TaxID=2810368 RepID=A0ABS2A991_9ACTN|nr:universal stress protein [Actinoplanes ovalisporus]MBM2616392.1 universal stress protein [Actinoplanes ovalisporus]
MVNRQIVVGTDGAGTSAAAVDWSAHEAQRRRVPLRIVHAFHPQWGDLPSGATAGSDDAGRQIAEVVAANAFDRAREVAPDISIETDTVTGPAVPRLLEVSRGAELLVVGNRGRGGFAGLLLGSVSRRVATQALCPVVVVRGRRTAAGGPIVAGVDHSPDADLVLQPAFAAASDQGCPIVVVRAYEPMIPLSLSPAVPRRVDIPAQDDAERSRLEARLAPWRAKYPELSVREVISHESAAAALVQASRDARLVVIGSHGHGLITGGLIGSTGLQLLHHAACPVQIARRPG